MTHKHIDAALVAVREQKNDHSLYKELLESKQAKNLIMATKIDLLEKLTGDEEKEIAIDSTLYNTLYIGIEAGLVAAKSATLPREFDRS